MIENKYLNKQQKQNNIDKEYDYSMTAKETIGAIFAVILGVVIFFGLQLVVSNLTEPFQIQLYMGFGFIIVGIIILAWIFKKVR